MYVKVTEEHLKKSVKAGTVGSLTRSPIARAMREAGFRVDLVGREIHLGDKTVILSSTARIFNILCFSYPHATSVNLEKRRDKLSFMRSLLPFKIRVPKLDNPKK